MRVRACVRYHTNYSGTLIEKYNLSKDFELSQTFAFFWDKYEPVNLKLQSSLLLVYFYYYYYYYYYKNGAKSGFEMCFGPRAPNAPGPNAPNAPNQNTSRIQYL